MFLRKEEKKVYDRAYRLVSYCKDCDSKNIEIIHICKDCGSKNIKIPSYNILENDNDEKAKVRDYTIKEFYIYKCDKCGKEFNGLTECNKFISEVYGEFIPYKDEEYGGDNIYEVKEDLCNDCLQKICDRLNKELEGICSKEHVNHVIKHLKE